MATFDWQALCRRTKGMSVDGEIATIELGSDRKQRVTVKRFDETIEFTSMVVRSATLDSLRRQTDVEIHAWRRNRSSQRVGFGFDAKGHLVAKAWIPLAGITPEEFLKCLRHVAVEADLFEYQLTGKDRE